MRNMREARTLTKLDKKHCSKKKQSKLLLDYLHSIGPRLDAVRWVKKVEGGDNRVMLNLMSIVPDINRGVTYKVYRVEFM